MAYALVVLVGFYGALMLFIAGGVIAWGIGAIDDRFHDWREKHRKS